MEYSMRICSVAGLILLVWTLGNAFAYDTGINMDIYLPQSEPKNTKATTN